MDLYYSVLVVAITAYGCYAEYLGHLDNSMMTHIRQVNEDIVKKAGDTLELQCSGGDHEFIYWNYPRKASVSEGEDNSGIEITASESEGTSGYISTLTVYNITQADTGLYECYCGAVESNVPGHVHHKRLTFSDYKVYVFVSDTESLFQGGPQEKMEFIGTSSRSDISLPCAVNNPGTTVSLYKSFGPRRLTMQASKKYRYDSKTGWTISGVRLSDLGEYVCEATDLQTGVSEEKTFYIHVMKSNALIRPPILRGLETVRSHSSALFKCQVAVGKGQVTVITWWKHPGNGSETRITDDDDRVTIDEPVHSQSICSGNRTMCSFKRFTMQLLHGYGDDSMYEKLTGRMRISNVQTSTDDSASYYCKVWSDGTTLTSNMFNVTVTPSITAYAAEGEAVEPEIINYINGPESTLDRNVVISHHSDD